MWVKSTNAFSEGNNVNIRIPSSGSTFRSATRDPLNERSSDCLPRVIILWCDVIIVFWQKKPLNIKEQVV